MPRPWRPSWSRIKRWPYLSYKLATIKTDVELDLKCSELEVTPPDVDQLQSLFKRYEFKRWMADVEAGTWLENKGSGRKASAAAKPAATAEAPRAAAEPTLSQEGYVTILDEETFADWMQRLKQAEVFAFDTETDGLDTLTANLIGLSFAIEPGVAAYLPVAHDYLDAPPPAGS
ncbi:DNA polymerase I [Serratia fonticola]|uniref:DNA polymerase I n=1 Tax=Serratia fonticola TaxID=47917 RepID=A0A4U9VB37_SERFO|nr:DNA polymerase I [Serratia fonticola]